MTSTKGPRLRVLLATAGLAIGLMIAPTAAQPAGAADPPTINVSGGQIGIERFAEPTVQVEIFNLAHELMLDATVPVGDFPIVPSDYDPDPDDGVDVGPFIGWTVEVTGTSAETGEAVTKEHIRERLFVDWFDPLTDVVDGSADPGKTVIVEAFDPVGNPLATTTAAFTDGNNWIADFSALADLQGDTQIHALIADIDFDYTMEIPTGRSLGASLTSDNMWGTGWPIQAGGVDITIDDVDGFGHLGTHPWPLGAYQEDSFNLSVGELPLAETPDLTPGDIITVTDGSETFVLTLAGPLTANLSDDGLYASGDRPDDASPVSIQFNDDHCPEVTVPATAVNATEWELDLSPYCPAGLLSNPYLSVNHRVPRIGGDVVTAAEILPAAPDPGLIAVLGPAGVGTGVHGWGWHTDQASGVRLEFFGADGSGPTSTVTAFPGTFEENAHLWADFDTPYGVGDRIVATGNDSGIVRDVVVDDVRVTSVDRLTGVVTGTTTSDGLVNVSADTTDASGFYPDQMNRYATSDDPDSDGVFDWTVDFTTSAGTDEFGAALTVPVDVLSGRAEIDDTGARYSSPRIQIDGSGQQWWLTVQAIDTDARITFDRGADHFETGVLSPYIDHLGIGTIGIDLRDATDGGGSLLDVWDSGTGWTVSVLADEPEPTVLAELVVPLLTLDTVNTTTGEITGTADIGHFISVDTGGPDGWDGTRFEVTESPWSWTSPQVSNRNVSVVWNTDAGQGHQLAHTYAWPSFTYSRNFEADLGEYSHQLSSFGGAPLGVRGAFPEGSVVTVTIDDPSTPAEPDYEFVPEVVVHPEEGVGSGFEFDLAAALGIEPADVGPGWVFTASAEIGGVPMSKTLVIDQVSVDAVDLDTGTASGTCTPGAQEWIVQTGGDPSGGWGGEFYPECTPEGTWVIDFDPADPVGYVWASYQDGDLDVNTAAWNVSNVEIRQLEVYPDVDLIGAWYSDAGFWLTIDRPGQGRVFDGYQPGPAYGFDLWALDPPFDVQRGDTVTMTDGETERVHTVVDIAVDTLVEGATLATGTGPPGRELAINLMSVPESDDSELGTMSVTVDGSGQWAADLGIPFEQGHSIEAVAFDMAGPDDNDQTHVFSYIAAPFITIVLNHGYVQGESWLVDETVTITVDDPSTPDDPDYSIDPVPMVDRQGPFPWDTFFVTDGGWDLQPGYTVTATSLTQTRVHTIFDLTMEVADVESGLFAGHALPEQPVLFAASNDFEHVQRWLTTTPAGDPDPAFWSIDVSSEMGIPLAPGTAYSVEVFDDDGDVTNVGDCHECDHGGGNNGPFTSFDEGDLLISQTSGTLWAWDTESDVLIDEYRLPFGGTWDIQYRDDGRLLIANSGEGRVMELDLATGDVVPVYEGAENAFPIGIAYDADADVLFIADSGEAGGVFRLDLTTGDVQQLSDEPADGIALGPDGYVYFGGLSRVLPDGTGHETVAYLSGYSPNGFVFTPEGTIIMTSMFPAAVLEIDISTVPASVTALYEGDGMRSPEDVALAPDYDVSGDIYVVDSGFVDEFGEDPALYVLNRFSGQLSEYERNGSFGDVVDLLIARQPPELHDRQPTFVVHVNDDSVEGHNWPEGAMIHLEILEDLDADPPVVLFAMDRMVGDNEVGTNGNVGFPFSGEFDVVPGHGVTMTDGETFERHIVQPVEVSEIDTDLEIVRGTADPGDEVWVFTTNQDPMAVRLLTADPEDGTWEADFSTEGTGEFDEGTADLEPGVQGGAIEGDPVNGNETEFIWRVPNPVFFVNPEFGWIGGQDWTDGAAALITIDDPETPDAPDVELSVPIQRFEPWEPPGFDLNLGEFHELGEFQIEPGHVVTVGDGVATKSHTVTDLAVSTIDPALDTVSGFAEPGAQVVVEVDVEFDIGEMPVVVADGSGLWTADFAGVFDIEPDATGRALEPDDDGDATQIDWRLPGPPEFGVTATHDWIEFYDFGPDPIDVTFDDDDDASNGVLYELRLEDNPGDPGWIHVIDDFDVEAGQLVTVTQGDLVKTLSVSPIEITTVDRDQWIVTGIADGDVQIDTFGFGPIDGFGEHMVQVDGSGSWTLDLREVTHVPDDNGDGIADEPLPDGVVLGGGQRDIDSDRSITFWDPAVVEGHVYVDDDPAQPVADAEVFLQNALGSNHTCTDGDGYYRFDNASVVLQLVRSGIVATGRAVNPDAAGPDVACSNADFLAPDGQPLVVGLYDEGYDLFHGHETIDFHVDRAAAYHDVVVEEFDGTDWEPADGFQVRAFDVGVVGEPDPADYGDVFYGEDGQVALDFTGVYLLEDPGTVELRYPAVTDLLVIVEYVDGRYIGQYNPADEFVDDGTGVLVGPTLTFPAAPVITYLDVNADPVPIGTAVDLAAGFSDPDMPDGHVAHIDWGDGSDPTMIMDPDRDLAASHAYDDPGIYTVSLVVSDDYGRETTEEYQFVVVYDPDGGFVTGGGWIDSPAGAYTPDPELTGRANFGFVAKYKKGKITPDGHTNFQFRAAGLHFQSTAYDWLIITGGERAKYKGSGTINGTGDYGFMLTAVDSDDGDTFRIKIWDEATGATVYDNKIDVGDGEYDGTELQGGSITVHTPKTKK